MGEINRWVIQVCSLRDNRSSKSDPNAFAVYYGKGNLITGTKTDVNNTIKGLYLRDIEAEIFANGFLLPVRISLGGGYGYYSFLPNVLMIDPFIIFDPYPLPEKDYEKLIAEGLFLRLPEKRYQELTPKPRTPSDQQALINRIQSRLTEGS